MNLPILEFLFQCYFLYKRHTHFSTLSVYTVIFNPIIITWYTLYTTINCTPFYDNPLVFDTFDKAVAANPGATPLLHSDRGYQYTSKAFRRRILAAGMTQSMSRVARCIDNGPMEGFWGLMKREMYYGKKYKTKEELMLAIEKYIDYYTNKRVQRNLGVLTPLEFHEQKLENVA